jgi:hypothetical protein
MGFLKKIFSDPATIIAAIIGAILTIIGMFILEKIKLQKERASKIKEIECVLIKRSSQKLDRTIFGAIAGRVEVFVPKDGPKSEKIEIKEVHTNLYRLRNFGDEPISNFLLQSIKNIPSIWFKVYEANNRVSPDWEQKYKELLIKYKDAKEDDWKIYPVPYINPYHSTKHEILLEISSYLPLKAIEINGGSKGTNFYFKSKC